MTDEAQKTSGEIDAMALTEASKAGVTSPATISDTAPPTTESLHMRIQELEAKMAHIFQTYFRTANVKGIVDEWMDRMAGPSEVLDKTTQGRP